MRTSDHLPVSKVEYGQSLRGDVDRLLNLFSHFREVSVGRLVWLHLFGKFTRHRGENGLLILKSILVVGTHQESPGEEQQEERQQTRQSGEPLAERKLIHAGACNRYPTPRTV